MNYLYGRYAVALMWAKTVANIDIKTNGFIPEVDFMPFEKADVEIINRIKQIVCEIN